MSIAFIVKSTTPPLTGDKDSSPYDRTMVENGTLTWDTSSKKFGASSLLLGGAGNLSTAYNTNLNLGTRFTISMWVNYTSGSFASRARMLMYYSYDESEGGPKPGGYVLSMYGTGGTYTEGSIQAQYWEDEGGAVGNFNYPPASAIADLGWSHVAFVRDLGNFYLFINGTSVGTNSGTGSASAIHGTVTNDFQLGRNSLGANEYFVGGFDEVLIVDGTALWTSNFTPPTTPWTDPGPAGTKLLLHLDEE